MGYTDPTFNRDLLGNRTLLFIFICAFAVVTLLQQILYGRNYLKSELQFRWQSDEELANWTNSSNFMDGGALRSGGGTGSRYRDRGHSTGRVALVLEQTFDMIWGGTITHSFHADVNEDKRNPHLILKISSRAEGTGIIALLLYMVKLCHK
ncbi:alpha-2,8-sialyltransferase 8E, partial [Python bivittatus]|uniref:Alpha-2,8-sialyltransferase 8E n=1 Tax=Python bivittatus TaxID=176946 RepID=A0A9F2WEZ5_PYTBI